MWDANGIHTHCVLTYIIQKKKKGCRFTMGNFKIPNIPMTTQKAIRFPNDLIERVEKTIRGRDCTFSAFVVEAVRNALDELEE